MTLRFDRGLPPAAALALLGGILALGSLLLPWYVLNQDAAKAMLHGIATMLSEAGAPGKASGELTATVDAAMPDILKQLERELVGYKVFSTVGVVFHALAAAGAILAALKVWSGDGTQEQHRKELLGAAAIMAFRPVYAFINAPSKRDEIPGVPIPDNILTPGAGIFVALVGAALVVAGALLVRDGSTAAEPEWMAPAAAPGGAFVPGGQPAPHAPAPAAPAYAAPAPAYAQPATQPYAAPPVYAPPAAPPAFGQPAPTYYTPGGAYGEEGPGTLDRDSRLVRPNDPYAPAPRAAPAVPIPPVPAAVTPINDPAPVVETPGSTYGVPAPQAPTRPGSTAPPGFS